MLRTQTSALAERLCRPQRIGVFGHRGVGKTTLLTMLYREAVAGRLPDLRLAAADARTANYLSDKITQLESGQSLPATLAETELRFHLYHRTARIELLVMDYQGEHVEIGREEPIRDFLRNCDGLWICLDAATLATPSDRLRRQQEVEQLIEDYLAIEPRRTMDRPVALVLTKADLLDGPLSVVRGQWSEAFEMTRHALQTHCPRSDLFAVSSLGAPRSPELRPRGLAEPLAWLAAALQAQDEARLEQLGSQTALLERGVACFARRYPDAPATAMYRQRLRELRRRSRQRRGLAGMAAAACLLAGVWTYDALGYQNAARFEADHGDNLAAVVDRWQGYQTWHPTRNLLRPAAAQVEENHLRDLNQQARQQEYTARLAELRHQAADADADPEKVWRQFQDFHAAFPEVDLATELQQPRAAVKARRDERIARRAQQAYDELISSEQRSADLLALIAQADRFLAEQPGSAQEAEVRRQRAAYAQRLEERDVEVARNYSASQPLNFQTRREHYQRYLDRHPGGAFTSEAAEALRLIDVEWDKHDFRSVRDHFLTRPGDIPELVARCRSYLAVHPHGQFTSAAADLLRWSERVTAPGEYRVVLRDGDFEHRIARFFSRGPDLSVEIEVAGVRYGPSNIVVNRYDPDWDYEFPRRIRWKLGDPVIIRVTDHDWKDRVVVEISSADGDPLALRLLSGEAWSGRNHLTFSSDFRLPALPKIE